MAIEIYRSSDPSTDYCWDLDEICRECAEKKYRRIIMLNTIFIKLKERKIVRKIIVKNAKALYLLMDEKNGKDYQVLFINITANVLRLYDGWVCMPNTSVQK